MKLFHLVHPWFTLSKSEKTVYYLFWFVFILLGPKKRSITGVCINCYQSDHIQGTEYFGRLLTYFEGENELDMEKNEKLRNRVHLKDCIYTHAHAHAHRLHQRVARTSWIIALVLGKCRKLKVNSLHSGFFLSH